MTRESPRILLVDDEDTFRKSTARLLEQEGYRCDCAQDSEEASRLLTSRHNMLLSDIRMPGNMQFEFLREIRARFPLLPVVLVTGYPSVQTAVEALRLSFTDYLLKPVGFASCRGSRDKEGRFPPHDRCGPRRSLSNGCFPVLVPAYHA
jgi:DNA-binding NtrC family response regulator